jgi:Glu-tRNA(Gln) amidotransferase subunit E-like FAD-binding protein
LRVEIYSKVKEDVKRWLESAIDELRRSDLDEKTVKSIAKATAATEVARLHNIVMEEFNEFKAEVEERLSRLGIDAETIRRIVDEVQNKLLSELDKRFMHVLSVIDEQNSSIKDVLDLVNEILKAEVAFEEELAKLRSEIRGMFSEERIEELFYRTLVKRGVIRQRRRRWTPLIAGLSILAAIIAGFIINPIATLVILFIAIVVLLRW